MGSPCERTLDEPLHVIRLHHPRFDALDGTGAALYGGRWNSPRANVVYGALTYGGAILETRVHANVRVPPRREIAVITVPSGTRISEFAASDVKDWDDVRESASRAAGDEWLKSARTVALIVPSKAGAPLEKNIVINLDHADARRLHVKSLGPVPWDTRLFVKKARPTRTPRKKK